MAQAVGGSRCITTQLEDFYEQATGTPGYVTSPLTCKTQQAVNCKSVHEVSAELELVIKNTAEHVVAQALKDLEDAMRQALQMLREELRSEFAEEASALQLQMSEMPSRTDLHSFGSFQHALKDQVDAVARMVHGLANGAAATSAVEEFPCSSPRHGGATHRGLEPEPKQDQSDGERAVVDANSFVIGELESKFTCLCREVANFGSSVEAMQERVTLQCESLTQRMSALEQIEIQNPAAAAVEVHEHPSKEDTQRVLEACHALRLDDVQTDSLIDDLRTVIAEHADKVNTVCQECTESHADLRSQIKTCFKSQEELRAKVTALFQERKHGAINAEQLLNVQEQLRASEAKHDKMYSVLEALTNPCAPQTVRA